MAGSILLRQQQQAIKEYTDKALQDPNLQSREKISLVSLNQNDRLSIIRRIQQHTFDHVFKKKEDFFTKKHHYDWWIFPMHVPAEWGWEQRNYDASITPGEAKILLQDKGFVETYSCSVTKYINALEKNGWNDYPVRYARMLQSLALFTSVAGKTKEFDKVYAKLQQLGTLAVDYAEKNVIKHHPDYDLLVDGYKRNKHELAHCIVADSRCKTSGRLEP